MLGGRGAAAAIAAAALLSVAAGGQAAAQTPEQTLPGQTLEIGRSVDGRPIEALRLGDPASPRKALVVGVIHGDERAGLKITSRLRRMMLTGVDLWVIDTVNPDGTKADRRGNAHGVDLNRNFPYRWHSGSRNGFYPGTGPLSEPESRGVHDFIEQIQPQFSVWYHQPWNSVLKPCHGPAPIQKRYARIAGMKTSCRGSGLPGTAINWQNHAFPGTTAIVVELPGHVGKRLVRDNALAATTLAEG
jgi:murein peptide amidase A